MTKPARYPELRVAPQPKCGRTVAIHGVVRVCDLPKDHIPAEQHQETTRWTA